MTYLYVVSIPIEGQTFYAEYMQILSMRSPGLTSTSPRDDLQNHQFHSAPFVAFPGQHFPLRLGNGGRSLEPKSGRTMLASLRRLSQRIGADRLTAFLPRQ